MKRLFVLSILAVLSTSIFSQVLEKEDVLKTKNSSLVEGWQHGGMVSVNLNQVALVNWAAGGQNSLATTGLVSLFAHHKKGDGIWENYLDIAYGVIKQGDGDWIKSDDKIDFTSKYGYKAFADWYYAALLNFQTQMAPGYNYPNTTSRISNLFAPAYLLGAIGMEYRPHDNFTIFIAPITTKMTFVGEQALADAGAFGVDPGSHVKGEFGGYLRLFFKRDLMENINLQTKLDLFSNYLENPQNIDVSWTVLVSMKINDYISAVLSTHLLYDDDIDIAVDNNNDGIIDETGPRVQFKETIGVGFAYKF